MITAKNKDSVAMIAAAVYHPIFEKERRPALAAKQSVDVAIALLEEIESRIDK